MSDWTWAAARARGTSHETSGAPCQDAFRCRLINGTLVAIVCDGAGSAEFGGPGAALATRAMAAKATAYFANTTDLPDDATLWNWIDEARDLIATAAANRNAAPRAFASTLVCVLATPFRTLVLHIGDGVAALRGADANSWSVPLWPAHGEYASSTFFLTDDPEPKTRIERIDGPISAVVAMSDGLERLALDFANQTPHLPFFENIVRPVIQVERKGHAADLSAQLQTYLQSEAINARTDDDKTLVVAVRS